MQEKFAAKHYEEQGDGQPGEEKAGGVAGGAMLTPKINLRMDDEPVERNRQLHEKHEGREPAERRHAGILVEWRVGRQCFRILGAGWIDPATHAMGLATEAQRHGDN